MDLILFVAIFCGILVIVNKNPIISVIFLIALFSVVAVYLIFIGLEFIGLAYLLVYVGAVSILFLFILMLINVRVSELTSDTSQTIPLIIFLTMLFVFLGSYLLPHGDKFYVSFISYFKWEGILSEASHISSLGNTLYTNYNLLLLIVSLILLLAMVGAILITVKSKNFSLDNVIENFHKNINTAID